MQWFCALVLGVKALVVHGGDLHPSPGPMGQPTTVADDNGGEC